METLRRGTEQAVKPLSEVTCCVCDYGTFQALAETMAEATAKTYYHTPCASEYECVDQCVIGDGMAKVERLDDVHDAIDEIDLWLFPDIGFGGLQRYLRKQGKLVWGSMGASDLELYRTRFIKLMRELELPVVNSVAIRGVNALSEHLKGVKDKWVKINRYRGNMETWHHLDYEHSIPKLNELAVTFGGVQNQVMFVVQDSIPDAIEIGYDGWTVDGEYPPCSFQGFERKNKLYLGSMLDYEELPQDVRTVNEAMSPVFKEYGYRNFFASEIRKADQAYFIDPTMRMPGQTGEHLLETCTNLPEVIYQGAQGNVITPEFENLFAAEATIHYTADCDGWRVLKVPDEVKRWVKLYHYCESDGLYHFPPGKNDELGVVVGNGDSIESAIEAVSDHFEALSSEPVSIDFEEFADLIAEIHKSEEEGLKFSDQEVPDPAIVIEN